MEVVAWLGFSTVLQRHPRYLSFSLYVLQLLVYDAGKVSAYSKNLGISTIQAFGMALEDYSRRRNPQRVLRPAFHHHKTTKIPSLPSF